MDLIHSIFEGLLVPLLSLLLEELLSLVAMGNMLPKQAMAPEGLWQTICFCFAGECTISTCFMACMCWSMACFTSPLVTFEVWHIMPCLFYLSGPPGCVITNGLIWYSLAPCTMVWLLCDSEKCHSFFTKHGCPPYADFAVELAYRTIQCSLTFLVVVVLMVIVKMVIFGAKCSRWN